jgi:hypothetical protein
MDPTEIARQILAGYNNGKEWDERSKIASVSLVLCALDIEPTETEWRDYLLISGLNIYDADTQAVCIDVTNYYYYVGHLKMTRYEEGSWVSDKNPYSALAVMDDDFMENVRELKDQLAVLAE